MSREIKFQRVYKSYMSDSDPIEFREWGVFDDSFIAPPNISGYQTVGDRQFTGLKDKNGAEIYEGDVVKVTTYVGGNFIETSIKKYVVIWKFFGFTLKPLIDAVQYTSSLFLSEAESIEIIGNIHQNPELL